VHGCNLPQKQVEKQHFCSNRIRFGRAHQRYILAKRSCHHQGDKSVRESFATADGAQICGLCTTTRQELRETWSKIPADTDVIFAHTPPMGYLDASFCGVHYGCDDFRQACERIRPRCVVFGHIHGGYGTMTMAHGTIRCINAASMEPLRFATGMNQPIVFDLASPRL